MAEAQAHDRRSPSPNTSSSPPHRRFGPTARAIARRIQEDWNTATDSRERFLYMFKGHEA